MLATRRPLRWVVVAAGLAVAPSVRAQPATVDPYTQQPTETVPACPSLDRADGQSRVGADLGWTLWKDSGDLENTDVTALRLDLHGQWVSPGGFGGYGIIPVSYGKISAMGFEESETALGDIELGAVYRLPSGPGAQIALHAGFTLPTAPEQDFGAGEGFANSVAVYARPHDFVHIAPGISYLRLGASPIFRSGQMFVRADGGADIAVYVKDTDANGDAGDQPKLGHVNLAGGVDTGQVAVLGELVNLINLDFESDDLSDDLLHFLGASVRYTAAPVQPSLGVLFPLDETVRDAISLVVMAGVTATIK